MRACKKQIALLGLLLTSCAHQPSESEAAASPITAEFNKAAMAHILKLYQADQTAASLKKRCDEMFSTLRVGVRMDASGPTAKCADISYTITARVSREVWNWKSGENRSVYVDNGRLVTINGTLSEAK